MYLYIFVQVPSTRWSGRSLYRFLFCNWAPTKIPTNELLWNFNVGSCTSRTASKYSELHSTICQQTPCFFGVDFKCSALIVPWFRVIVLVGMYLYKSFTGSVSSRRIPPRTTYQKIYELFFYVESRERFVKFILCTGAILFFITRIFRGLARTWNTLCNPVSCVLQNAGYIQFIGDLLFGAFSLKIVLYWQLNTVYTVLCDRI